MEFPFAERITHEPGKFGGKACIRGLRVTVANVLGMLSAGATPDEILRDFPYLEREDIQACLSYAAWRLAESDVPLPA